MKNINKAIIFSFVCAFLLSCGNSSKKDELSSMKSKLEKLRSERTSIDNQITSLEEKLSEIDTGFSTQKPKLVTFAAVQRVDFKHYVTLQGNIDQKNVSYITPSGQPGQIKAIYIKQGEKIKKGQLVLRLDNSVAIQNVNAIKQQLNTVKAQLDLAKSVYTRQKNLWANNIGTEVQLLQARTNVESLEGQMKTIEANVNAAQVMANQSAVYSDVSGTVDEITAHVGETFNGNPLTGGFIRIVNTGDTRVSVIVPENYTDKIAKGNKVIVNLTDMNKSFEGVISFISETIGATTRGFTAEIKVPSHIAVSPNQTAVVKILDYSAPNAISVPLNTVQNDENGKYVLVAVKSNGKWIAKKKPVTIGQFNDDSVEVKQGLEPGDMIITSGFQEVFDGQTLTTQVQ